MEKREGIKAALKTWMITTIRATQRRAALTGHDYHPSDISFVFRDKLGIRMNEDFVLKCLGTKKKSPEERTKT